MALIVNGQQVDSSWLDQEFANVKSYFESLSNIQCCERDEEFRGYARDNVIARVLLAQEAKERVAESTAEEIEREIAAMKEAHGSEGQFYAALGLSPDQEALLHPDVDLNLRVQKLMEQIAQPLPDPSEEELRAFYEAHIDQFKTEEQVRALHMLQAPRRGEERAAAYDDLREARRKARAGEDFAELAKAYSAKWKEWHEADEETRQRMGDPIDLGFFARGQMMEEFEAVAFSLEEGEVGPVFLTHFGFHLVKVVERKPAAAKPFDAVREEARELCLNQHRQEAAQQHVAALRERATIEFTEGEDQPQPSSHTH